MKGKLTKYLSVKLKKHTDQTCTLELTNCRIIQLEQSSTDPFQISLVDKECPLTELTVYFYRKKKKRKKNVF